MPNEYGRLTVRAYTAGGGLPVEGARVTLKGLDEKGEEKTVELITDKSGNTKTVDLPAPLSGNSLTPDNPSRPYSLYDLTVEKEGYYTRRVSGVTVFSGINSLQLINMIPTSDSPINEAPRGNINATIPNYTDLI